MPFFFYSRKEIKLIRWKTGILATFASLNYSCQTIATFISLLTLLATGTEPNSYNTLMILSLVSSLRTTVLSIIAQQADTLAGFAAALSRSQNILDYENGMVHKRLQDAFRRKRNSNSKEDHCLGDGHFQSFGNIIEKVFHFQKHLAILLQNVVCSWTRSWNTLTLKSMSLSVEKGDLVFITGPLGCCKSSVMYSILREICF